MAVKGNCSLTEVYAKCRIQIGRRLQWLNRKSAFLFLCFPIVSLDVLLTLRSSHTNHNQSKKAHRNGIKKPKSNRSRSLKGVSTLLARLFVSAHMTRVTQVDAKVHYPLSMNIPQALNSRELVPPERPSCPRWLGAFNVSYNPRSNI